MTLEMQSTCIECSGHIIQTDSDFVCQNCGLVQDDLLLQTETNLDNKVSVYHHDQMYPIFVYSSTFPTNQIAYSASNYKYLRLRKYSYSNMNRKMRTVSNFLNIITSNLQLAESIYSDCLLLTKRFLLMNTKKRPKSLLATATASILIITKINNTILPLNELMEVSRRINYNIKQSTVLQNVYEMKSAFNLKYVSNKPIDYISKVTSEIYQISSEFQTFCTIAFFESETIANISNYPQNKLGSKNPYLIAIAFAYFTHIKICRNLKKSRKISILEIAKKLNVSAPTMFDYNYENIFQYSDISWVKSRKFSKINLL